MKKLFLVLLGGLLLTINIFAQIGGTTQRGKATHEMNTAGFFAAHGSFPLGSTIKVVNTVTGKEIDATVISRIRSSPDRLVDLSPDAWNALELTADAVVMLVYSPPSASRTNPEAADPQPAPEPEGALLTEIPSKNTRKKEYTNNEMTRLNASQTLYHLLLLERKYCASYADISDVQSIHLLYKFLHGKNGYLVAIYSSSQEGPVFPVMPDKSRILVDIITSDKAFLRDYVNSAAFKRFVVNPQVLSQIQKTLQ